ncbi:hypothetical protein V3C99_005683 [Haemonchus contortus]
MDDLDPVYFAMPSTTMFVMLFLTQIYSSSIAYTFFRRDVVEKVMHVRGERLHGHYWYAVHGECLGECLGNIKCNLAVVNNENMCYLYGENSTSTWINTIYNTTRVYRLDRNMNRTDCEKVSIPWIEYDYFGG